MMIESDDAPLLKFDVTVEVEQRDGFYVAKAWPIALWTGTAYELLLLGAAAESRDEKRAISYALTDLAAKISGGR